MSSMELSGLLVTQYSMSPSVAINLKYFDGANQFQVYGLATGQLYLVKLQVLEVFRVIHNSVVFERCKPYPTEILDEVEVCL